ncbi:lytic transglycosylase domain-containing protein [Methylosinus sp. Sm6]|uniref:lytic murein transglycosylase n=1 Tax=Methylosinus sp. Sm6 TaxID=2866948 RepID=UPI001C9984DB|nr:lytic murein transglycosylase [Methylosinus sp. Sm6]MBY6243257.1 lytic murein transglycosylase [Methylosinus sp. Sm6]
MGGHSHFRGLLLAAALTTSFATAAVAAEAEGTIDCGRSGDGFEAWLDSFKREATTAGISQRAIQASLADVYYDRSVISHDRGQKVFRQSFEQFSARMANSFRVNKGRQLLQRHAALFRQIEQRYGVPGPVLVAIWGLETDFGAFNGSFATIRALATLAYDCRRAERFRAELLDALRIVDRGDLSPDKMHGAWAGEIGQTQFMPSSYLKFAVDFNGDGSRDLVHDTADVLASTANFLHGYGWKPGAGWDEGEPNFAVLLEWNKAKVYSKTIALLADRIDGR